MNRQRVQMYYEGRVQGVGFRYAVKSLVPGFELTGVIRNLEDGRVELVAEGGRDELDAFLQAIRDSQVGHFIVREDATWFTSRNEFRGFAIVS